ncbi:hypothetical protein EDC45_1293 [Mesocricetibacter intestinalis]|uniref:Lipoprotein n=1 Tax=Mesocricetibacter intestinalis TaxID=1521930 RepID=A0A4R6V7R4_9PAST|nr:hypothetical protein [Mesocricetibacter intestinalis]TDQ57646.1 hypothetical protein EDC45_1293 [Mesocricetibacter intestinalis]
MNFKQLVNTSLTLTAIVSLSACVKTGMGTHIEPQGKDVGQLIVFTPNNSGDEIISIALNNKFLAALPSSHQVNQNLCRGDYTLKASLVLPYTGNQIRRIENTGTFTINQNQTTYIAVERTTKGLSLSAVDQSVWENSGKLNTENKQLLRRLPASFFQCGADKAN